MEPYFFSGKRCIIEQATNILPPDFDWYVSTKLDNGNLDKCGSQDLQHTIKHDIKKQL